MRSNKYLPSLGFVILTLTIICSILFIKWVVEPLSYEEAQIEEQKGHESAKNGNLKEASKHFLIAAKIDDDNISTSRRYRCAGSTSSKKSDKIEYFTLALKYNPNNEIAKKGLTPNLVDIRYKNRYQDGWSQGKSAKALLNVTEKESFYEITYYINNPQEIEYRVKMQVDGHFTKEEIIKTRETYKYKFTLSRGKHEIKLSINHTFNPKKLGMGDDDRDLGIHFEIRRIKE